MKSKSTFSQLLTAVPGKNGISLLLTIFFLSFYGAFSQNTWTQKASVSKTRAAVGFSIGNKGYIGTGDRGVMSATDDFWQWDQLTNVWTQKANVGSSAPNYWGSEDFYLAVGFSIGAKGYIGTGESSVFGLLFWEYDPGTNSWTKRANFGGMARSQAVGFSIGNFGYIGTGMNSAACSPFIPYSGYTTDYNDLWQWDQATDVWSQMANLPGNGRYGATGFSIGTKGYIGTGADINSTFYQEFWEWDQVTNVWTQKALFPGTARNGAVAFSIGNQGYIGTGADKMGNNLKDFWQWNQASNTWTQKTNFGGVARHLAVGFSIGNKGYIGTGDSGPRCDDPNKVENSGFWEFTPDSISCTATATIFSDPAPNTTFCVGQNVYLAASGGTSYVWSTGDTGVNIAATLSVTTTYSVTVTDANGCTGTSSTTFIVDPNCTTTGISQFNDASHQITIWPNPSNGMFNVEWLMDNGNSPLTINRYPLSIEIYNVMGEKVYSEKIHNPQPVLSGAESSQILNLDLPDGIYYLRVKPDPSTGSGGTITQKLIINK